MPENETVLQTAQRANRVLVENGQEPITLNEPIPVGTVGTTAPQLNTAPVIPREATPDIGDPQAFLASIQPQETALDRTSDALLGRIGDLQGQSLLESRRRAEIERQQDIAGKTQTLNDLTNQFNNLDTARQALPLQVQEEFAGRGATRGGTSTIQASRDRQLAIQQLGTAASLQAAQGNLATAQNLVDRAVAAEFDPIRQELDVLKTNLQLIEPFLDRQEKRQAEARQLAIRERERQLDLAQNQRKGVQEVMMTASQFGADPTTLSTISNARTVEDAIKSAGTFLQNPNIALQRDKLAAEIRRINQQITHADLKLAADAHDNNIFVNGSIEDISEIFTNNKIGAGTKSSVGTILGVQNAIETLANANPNGEFKGTSPLNNFLQFVPFREQFRSASGIETQGFLEGINLKIQQWASGAALTEKQTEQVKKMTPTDNDSDKVMRTKANNLYNFMNQQIRGALQVEGINYQPDEIDLFAPQTLEGIFGSNT